MSRDSYDRGLKPSSAPRLHRDRSADRALESAREKRAGEEHRWRELTTVLPLARLGTVDEVADTVVFLASERSSFSHGAIVTIDGGFGQRRREIKEWLSI